MRRRPLAVIFLSFTFGVICASILGIKTLALWPIIGVVSSMWFFIIFEYTEATGSTVLIVTGLFFLGALYYGSRYFNPVSLYTKLNNLESVEGKVVTYPVATEQSTEFTLNTESNPGKLKVYLDSDPGDGVDYGDKLTISGKFETPTKFDDFNYREYLRKQGIWGVVYSGQINESKEGNANPILELGWFLREKISERIENLFSDGGDFLKALLFGAGDVLGEEKERYFTSAGLAHLLAASGLHLGIILGVSWWTATKLGLSKSKIYLFSLPIVFLYLLIVGFKLPLLRASLIYLFGCSHVLLKKTGCILDDWYDRYQALAAAALILVLLNPETVSTVGFQLSFGATFAIAFFFQTIETKLPLKPDYLCGVLSASLAAQIGVGPVLAIHFHQAHPWAPLVNLVAIPGVTAVLYLGILSLTIGNFIPLFSGLIWLEEQTIFIFQGVIKKLSSLPFAQINLPQVTPLALASYIILIYWLERRLSSNQNEESPLKSY